MEKKINKNPTPSCICQIFSHWRTTFFFSPAFPRTLTVAKCRSIIKKVIHNRSSAEFVSLTQTICLFYFAAFSTLQLHYGLTVLSKTEPIKSSVFTSVKKLLNKNTQTSDRSSYFPFTVPFYSNTYCQDFIKKRNSSFVILLLIGR